MSLMGPKAFAFSATPMRCTFEATFGLVIDIAIASAAGVKLSEDSKRVMYFIDHLVASDPEKNTKNVAVFGSPRQLRWLNWPMGDWSSPLQL